MVSLPEQLRKMLKVKEVRVDGSRGCATFVIEFDPEMLDIYGYIHGSVISILNIIGAEVAARLSIRGEEILIVVNSVLNFIKQPEVFGDLEVESCVVTRTDRLVLVSTIIRCGEIDIGRGSVLFVTERIE